MKLYVAYGSNLCMEQMFYRCPDAEPLASALLKDCKLTFRGNSRTGVANIEKSKGSVVPIGIWAISDKDEKCLDRYEGYPHLYTKASVNLCMYGKDTEGLIYVMTQGHRIQAPSEYYADIIREGYHDFGLDVNVLNKAIAEAAKLDCKI